MSKTIDKKNKHMKTKSLLIVLVFLSTIVGAQELALAKDEVKFGYINKSGEWAIQPEFKGAKSFSEDLAEAMNDKKEWGFINRKGEWVIPPTYDKTKAFNSGIAVVLSNKEWFYINTKGEKVLTDVATDKIYDFTEGLAQIRQGDNVGFINTSGTVVIEPKFNKAFDFENGYAKVREGEKWGLVDKTGNYFVETKYDGVSNAYNGNVVATLGESHGLIINGKFKKVDGAQKIWDFSVNGDITYAKKNDKIGFINKTGEWIIEPTYDKVRAFVNGLAPVSIDKQWGYINTSGKVVIPIQYRDAEIFSSDGLAPIKKDKLWGFINTAGEQVIEDKYEITAGGFSIFKKNNEKGFVNGLARVKDKKSWVYIDTKGKVLKNMEFKNLELFN
ncbi:WG repeat-containing protein [Lacinutrix sp. WUR7]|uniref:WG repeat-containing protein n=1 Tax=Lacinutrix sp. WUR7 TaxID=2653681 RepID=UPI001EF117EB|nr:WG repeat-containing protein [Lacinutrix sp. WUR7]